jgi:adenylylsulfate kinase
MPYENATMTDPVPAPAPPSAPTLAVTARTVTKEERQKRYGHPGIVLWLTGLSGAGKSTLCRALERRLFDEGHHVYSLEGDELRHGLNANLGFSQADRRENVRRAAEVAKILCNAGVIAIMALISPHRDDRRTARKMVEDSGGKFIQVFVNASLEVCEGRDVKGLYGRARAGVIPEFTGISSPYDLPVQSEIVVQTDRQTVEECVAVVLAYLRPLLKAHEQR